MEPLWGAVDIQNANIHIHYKIKDLRVMRRFNFGGGKRSRTAGLRVANASLYQLSYTPTFILYSSQFDSICQGLF